MYPRAKFLTAGDTALTVELGDVISPEINRQVRNLFLALDSQQIPGVIDLVPTYRSILVNYDPLRLSRSSLENRLRLLEQHLEKTLVKAANVIEFPTVYGGEYGADLEHVADHHDLTVDEVIHIHSSTDYLVYMMGFTPGFAYLGGLSERIATPRLQTPRTAIPAGSVGIAENQTGVYPVESPGGWQIIGRTPVTLFNPQHLPPVLVEPGDSVRFIPIAEDRYLDIQRQVLAGSYEVISRPVE